MTWEELIAKFNDDGWDSLAINIHYDIRKSEVQEELEKYGITSDGLYIEIINSLISEYIHNSIFKDICIDFNTHPLEAIVYRNVLENLEDIRVKFTSLFKSEDELIKFFRKIKHEKQKAKN